MVNTGPQALIGNILPGEPEPGGQGKEPLNGAVNANMEAGPEHEKENLSKQNNRLTEAKFSSDESPSKYSRPKQSSAE